MMSLVELGEGQSTLGLWSDDRMSLSDQQRAEALVRHAPTGMAPQAEAGRAARRVCHLAVC